MLVNKRKFVSKLYYIIVSRISIAKIDIKNLQKIEKFFLYKH